MEPREGVGVYHCISRVVGSEWLLGPMERERLRVAIGTVAEFCGVEVLTYVVLSNHFHVVVRVPEYRWVESEEVLRRYGELYPGPSRYRPESWEELKQEVLQGTAKGLAWLEKQRRQMGDVSHYMKLLKQHFTVWYNHQHDRHGTLWSERFRSLLIEEGAGVRKVSGYVDLNAVRADLVDDPKDYRFCGYAEAIADQRKARQGLQTLMQEPDWDRASSLYRVELFGAACAPREKGRVLDINRLLQVMNEGGKLSMDEVHRCRDRYLTDGGVLGSPAFVQKYLDIERRKYNRVRGLKPKELPPIADWGGLTTMRKPHRGLIVSEPATPQS